MGDFTNISVFHKYHLINFIYKKIIMCKTTSLSDLLQKLSILEIFVSLGATTSAIFWVLQRTSAFGSIDPSEDHVQPFALFEAAIAAFCAISVAAAIAGSIAACLETNSAVLIAGAFSTVCAALNLMSLGYALYIGIQAILGYRAYNLLLALDLIPYVPALVLVIILVGLFFMSSFVGFKMYRELQVNLQRFDTTYADYLANGTINKNYAPTEVSDIGLYKTMVQEGFDLRPVNSLDMRREIEKFETLNKNDTLMTY